MLVSNLKPPYFAVIFSTITTKNLDGYEETSKKMENLAKQQKGYLGIETARQKIGITVSYWKSEADILAWKNNFEHILAREKGRTLWYQEYQIRICKVERAYEFSNLTNTLTIKKN